LYDLFFDHPFLVISLSYNFWWIKPQSL
jgi:hypothetical protein